MRSCYSGAERGNYTTLPDGVDPEWRQCDCGRRDTPLPRYVASPPPSRYERQRRRMKECQTAYFIPCCCPPPQPTPVPPTPDPPTPDPPTPGEVSYEAFSNQAANTSIVIVPNSIRVYYDTPSVIAYIPWLSRPSQVPIQLHTELEGNGSAVLLTVRNETSNTVLTNRSMSVDGFYSLDVTLPDDSARISISISKLGSGDDPYLYGLSYVVPVPPQS